jgi:hypothetical protein
MNKSIRRPRGLVKNKTNLAKRPRKPKSLSGEEILDSLIMISDEADMQFTPDLLKDIWNVLEGDYSKFIRDIAAKFGLNEKPLYDPHEPISGYSKHHFLRKRDLARLIPHAHILDPSMLEKTRDEDELLLVSYHNWYSINSSRYYFNSENVSSIHEKYLRFRGIREESEVETEIVKILKPHQINHSESPLSFYTSEPRDIFEYKQRLFSLPQKACDYKNNNGGLADLIWALGIYTTWPEPLGYIQFNKQQKFKKRLFLPP